MVIPPICYILSYTAIFENLELKSYDLRFRIRGPVEPDSNIVLIAVDDQSFISLNTRWPFPRSYFARLIENLNEAGARLIIFDVTFTEQSQLIPREDRDFSEALAKSDNVILAGKMVHEMNNAPYLMKPIPMFEQKAHSWGLVNIPEDQDGFVRSYNLFQTRRDSMLFPLGIEILHILETKAGYPKIENKLYDLTVGRYLIPKFNYNSILINYCGPRESFRTYSVASILDDATFELDGIEDTNIFDFHREQGTFKNKIVFVGASAEELQDNKLTPFFSYGATEPKTPGMEVHANALNTIISKNYLSRLPFVWVVLLVIFFTILAVWIARTFSPLPGISLVTAELLLIFVLIAWLFIRYNFWAPMVFPFISILFAYGTGVAFQIWMERQEKGRYRKTFELYMARNVVETMLARDEMPRFGGERKELTVLFSDIRSFTTFSEKHQPEEVVAQLSEYLTAMTQIVFKNNGTLDKYVGDEIMAVFGAPLHFQEHAFQACKAAVEMMDTLREIQKNWATQNKASFDIGIGINTGKVIVGNLGSEQLFDYTVIGDEVNLGARLEGANKQYGTAIILSESTYTQAKNKIVARELDFVRVKGKNKPVKIYELLGIYTIPDHEQKFLVEIYSRALSFYKQKNWYLAIKEFNQVLRHFPDDEPSRVYIRRCLDYISSPPPKNWDGVFVFSSK